MVLAPKNSQNDVQSNISLSPLFKVNSLVVSGGVASNSYIRAGLGLVADHFTLPAVFPPARLCTDNGVMMK